VRESFAHAGAPALLVRAGIRVRVASLIVRESFAHVARLASFRAKVNGMLFAARAFYPIKKTLKKTIRRTRPTVDFILNAFHKTRPTIDFILNAFRKTRPTVDFILKKIRQTSGKGMTRGLKLLLLGGRDRARGIIEGKPYVRANALPVTIGVAALCGIIFFSSLMTRDLTYYEYSYNGKVLGVVKDVADVYRTVSRPEARETINERVGAAVILDDDENIEVKKVIKLTPSEVSVDKEDDIISNIATLGDVNVVGMAVQTGKDDIGTLASDAEVDKLLGLIKDYWLGEEDLSGYSEVGFTDEVTTVEITTARKNLETAEEIFARLSRTSFSAIGVRTVELMNYEEEYEETPVYIDDKKRYEDYELVLTPGATGLRNVTAEYVRVNGEFAEKTPVSYDVVQPAIAAYAVRGTKKLPKPIGSGKFTRPAKGGAITSPFGPRWGRMHKGIDIDINYAPVYAAGDGKVVYTGNKGDGYGMMIMIDHGESFETLYGHLSRSSVNVGDEVYKGQRIATSGNSGRSTGAHLHFEVRINGVQRNPLGYL
jgi:murein DD-endopeptidase MepM/ murein hydrolase activator NlpD